MKMWTIFFVVILDFALVASFTRYLPLNGMKTLQNPWINVVNKGCIVLHDCLSRINHELAKMFIGEVSDLMLCSFKCDWDEKNCQAIQVKR